MTLVLAVLLADPLLGGLWTAITGARWRERWAAAPVPSARPARSVLSTAPHGGRLARASPGAGRSPGWARQGDDEADGGLPFALTRAAFFLAAALAVAAVLGPEATMLVAAAAALAWLQGLLGVYLPGVRWPESVCLFGIPWLVGMAAFGGLPARVEGLPLVALAAAWTLAYFGYRGLVVGRFARQGAGGAGRGAAPGGGAAGGRAGARGRRACSSCCWPPRLWGSRATGGTGTGCRAPRGALPYLVAAVLVTFI